MSLPRILSVHSQQQSDLENTEEPLIIPKKEIDFKLPENLPDCEIIMIESDNDDDKTGEKSKSTKPSGIELRHETSVELVDPVKLTETMPPETKQAVAALCRNTSLSLQLLPNNTPRRVSQSSSNSTAKVAQSGPNSSRKVARLVPTVAKKVSRLEQNSPINTAQLDSEPPIEVVQWVPVVSATAPTTPTTIASQMVSALPVTNTTKLVPTATAGVAQLVQTAPQVVQPLPAAPQQIAQFVLHAPAQVAQSVSTAPQTIAQFVLSAPVTVSQSSLNAPVTVAQFVLAPPPITKVAQSTQNSSTTNVTKFVLTPPVTKTTQSPQNPPATHVTPFSSNSPTPMASQAISTAAAATIAQFLPMASSKTMNEFLPNVPTVEIPPMVPNNSLKVEQMITNAAAKLVQMGTNPIPANLPQPVPNSYAKLPQMVPNLSTRVNSHTTIVHKRPNVVMVVPVNNTSSGPFKSPTICTLERIQNPNEISMIKQVAAQRQKQAITQNNAAAASPFVVSNVVSTASTNSVNNAVSNVSSTVARLPKEVINVEKVEERSSIITSNVARTSNLSSNEARPSIITSSIARPSNIVSNVIRTATVVNDGTRASNVTSNVVRTSTVVSEVARTSNVVSNVVRTSTTVNDDARPLTVSSNVIRTSAIVNDVPRPLDVMTNVPQPSNNVKNDAHSLDDEKRADEIRKKFLHNLFLNSNTQKRKMMTEIHHVPWSDEKSQEEEFFAESQKTLIPLSREATVDPFGIAKRALSLAKKAAIKGPQARVSLVDVRKLLTKGVNNSKNTTLKEEQNNDDDDGSSKKMTNHTRPMSKSIVTNMKNGRLRIARRNSRTSNLSALARIQARLTRALSSIDQKKSTWKAQCIVCKEKFNDKYEFHRHATLAHPDVQILFCELCSDSFLTDVELKDHRLSYHKITVMKDAQGNITKIEPLASTTFEPLETIKSEDEISRPSARKKRRHRRRKSYRRNRASFETIPGHSQDSYRGRMMKKRAAVAAAKATVNRRKLSQFATRRRKPMTKNKTRKTGYDYVDEDVVAHGSVINKSKFKSAEIKKLIVPLTRLRAPVLDKYLAKLAAHPITSFGQEESEFQDNFRTSSPTNSDWKDSELEHLCESSASLSPLISEERGNLDTESLNVDSEISENRVNLEKSNLPKKSGPKRVMTSGYFRGRGKSIQAYMRNLQLARAAKIQKKDEYLKNNSVDESLEITDESTSVQLNLPSVDEKKEKQMGGSHERESVIVNRGKVQKSMYSESDDSMDDDNWTSSYQPEVTSNCDEEEESGTLKTSVKKEVSESNETLSTIEASGCNEIFDKIEVSGSKETSETIAASETNEAPEPNVASASKKTPETNAVSGSKEPPESNAASETTETSGNKAIENEASEPIATSLTMEECETNEASLNEKSKMEQASGREKIETEETLQNEKFETKGPPRKEKCEIKEKSEKEKVEMEETSVIEESELKETSGINEVSATIEESSELKKSQNIEKSVFDTARTKLSFSQDLTSIELHDDKGIAEIVKERQVIRKLVSKSSATSYAVLENKREKNPLQTEKGTIDDRNTESCSSSMKKISIYTSSDENSQSEHNEVKKREIIPLTRSKSFSDGEKSSIERAYVEKSPKLRAALLKSTSHVETSLAERLRSRHSQAFTSASSKPSSSDEKRRGGRLKLNRSPPSHPTILKSFESSEKRPRGRPRVNKSPANNSKLPISVGKRPRGRPRVNKLRLSRSKNSKPLSDAEKSSNETSKFEKSLPPKSSEKSNENEVPLSAHEKFLRSESSERNKFSTTKPLLNSTKNRKRYGRIIQMPRKDENIDRADKEEKGDKEDKKEKELQQKTDDKDKQLIDQIYDLDDQENDENSDEEKHPKATSRYKTKQRKDKDYSPRETRRKKTYGSDEKNTEVTTKSKSRQLLNAKRKSIKSKDQCFSCKKLMSVMKKVTTQLAGKNIAKTAIKCIYCKRYFISMFHLEVHIEGKHLQCENKIPCKKMQNAVSRKFRKNAELDSENEDDSKDDGTIVNETSSFRTNVRERILNDSKKEEDSSNTKADMKKGSNNSTSQSNTYLTKILPTFDCALCDAKFSKSTEYVRHVREIHDFSKTTSEKENRMKSLDDNEASTSSRSNEVSPVDISKKASKEIFEDLTIGSDDQMTADREFLLKQLLSDDSLDDDDKAKSNRKKSQLGQESQTDVFADVTSECIDKSGKKVIVVKTSHVCRICDKKFLRAHDLLAHSLLHVGNETEQKIIDSPENTDEEKTDSDRHGLFSDPFADDRHFDDSPKFVENEVFAPNEEISDQLSDPASEENSVVHGSDESRSKVVIGIKRAATSDLDETQKTSTISETIKKPRTCAKDSRTTKKKTKIVKKVKKPMRPNDEMKELLEMEKTLTEDNDDDKKLLECTKCNRNFATRTLLNEHLFFLHDDTLKDTVLTGLLTPIPSLSSDKNDGPHRCEDCKIDFKWAPSYSRHRYFHHGDDSQVHVCENCCKVLTSITMVNVHICTDVASYKCRTCNETFTTGMSLRLHNSEKHIEREGPHFCQPCKKNFLTKAMLERHVSGEHKFFLPYRPRKGSPVRMGTNEDIFQAKAQQVMAEREIKKSLTGPRQPPRRMKKFKNLDKVMDEVIASSDIMWNENEDNLIEEEPSTSYDAFDEYNDESVDRLEDSDDENLEGIEDSYDENLERLEDYNDENLDIFKNEIDEDFKEISLEIRSIADRLVDENDDDLEENLIDEEQDDFQENWIDDIEEDHTRNSSDNDEQDLKRILAETQNEDLENLSSQNDDKETKTLIDKEEPTKPRRGGWRACRGKKLIEDERPKNRKLYRPESRPGKRRRGRPRKYPLTDEETSDENSQDDENIDVLRESTLYVDENEIHQCSLCLLYCLSRSTLRNHMAKIHSTTDEVCQLCQKMYPTGKLIRHMMENHITPDQDEETRLEIGWQLGKDCNEMDMELFVKMMGIDRLVSLYEYRRYADTTTRLTSYPCPICDHTFPSSELYRYHYLLHHDTMCAVCNIEYKRGPDAARHKGEIHGSVGRYIWFADRTLKALTMTRNFAKFAERNFIDLITRDKTVGENTIPDDGEDTMNDTIDQTDDLGYTEIFVQSTIHENVVTNENDEETTLIDEIPYNENASIANEDETTNVDSEANLSDENSKIEDEEERTVEEEIFSDENETNEVETTLDQITNSAVENISTMERRKILGEESLLDGNIVVTTNEGQTRLEEELLFDENVAMIVNQTSVVDNENYSREKTIDETLLNEDAASLSNACKTEFEQNTSFVDENMSIITYEEETIVIMEENLPDQSITTITYDDGSMLVDNGTSDENNPEITNADETAIAGDENPSDDSATTIRNENDDMLVDEYILPDVHQTKNKVETSCSNFMDKMATRITDEIETNLVAHEKCWAKENSKILEAGETLIAEDATVLDERTSTIGNEEVEETRDDVDSIVSDDFAEPDDINMIIVVTDEDLDRFNITTRYPNIWGLAAKISSTFDGVTPKEVKDLLACHFERPEDFEMNCV